MAGLGSGIIVSSAPKGVHLEGQISGTPKPGTMMQVKATALVQEMPVWEVFNKAGDGDAGLVCILLPDKNRGKLNTDAYADEDWGFLYCPIPGEQLNILFDDDGAGTSDDVAIGDELMVVDGQGTFKAATGEERNPFIALEALTDPTADVLLRAIFTAS